MKFDPVLQRFKLTPTDLKRDTRFAEALKSKAASDEIIADLKQKQTALEDELRRRGREVVVLGTARPPKFDHANPLVGLPRALTQSAMQALKITDEDIQKDIRFGYLLKAVVMNNQFIKDVRKRLPAIQGIVTKLKSKDRAEAHQEQQ